MRRGVPCMAPRTASTSSRVRTRGTRTGRFARITPRTSPSSRPSTSWSRNRSALKAWFWVEALTWPFVARWVRKRATSAAPSDSAGRGSQKTRKRAAQPTYAFSVRGL